MSAAKDKTTTSDGHNGIFSGPENTREENNAIKLHASYVEVNVTIKSVCSSNNSEGSISHAIVLFRTERLKSTT